jgi:hypothetical protein
MKVDAGTRAVVFDKIRGVQDKVVGEGTHFRIPFIQVSHPTANAMFRRPISKKSLIFST